LHAITLLLTLMVAQPELRPLSPADAVAQAHADLVRLPADARQTVRYLSLYSLPAAERAKAIQVLSGHVNGLSRGIDLVPVRIIPDAQGSLLRLDLRDYEWNAATWEKLVDPYFSTVIETQSVVPWEGGLWEGKHYPQESFTYYKKKRVQALAPWLTESEAARKQLADVTTWTYSQMPIVRGDWFLYQTAIQEGRAVGYYDFLGIQNQKDFEKAVRFDAQLAAKLEHRRAVVFSGIALQPRRIERVNTVLGGLWRTFDNERAIAEKNPLKILDDNFQFVATEQIGPLPNGMPAFYLGDNKGTRQDKAPDNIVGGDRLGSGNDTRLHINLSCLRCHFGLSKTESGVKEADFAKITKLKSSDFEKYLDLKRQYLRDLTDEIKIDRSRYAAAIKRATGGMTPFDYGVELSKLFARYDGPVTPDRAAADLGIEKARMLAAFRAYDARADLDPVLSLLMDGKSIGVQQWEEVIPIAHSTIRGYQP
jgi:hypothetical protein